MRKPFVLFTLILLAIFGQSAFPFTKKTGNTLTPVGRGKYGTAARSPEQAEFIVVPFSSKSDPTDLEIWRYALAGNRESKWINLEKFSGKGGCRCVQRLVIRGEE